MKTSGKLTVGIISIIVLAVCLGVTTFALVRSTVAVESSLFRTGTVKINLNDGQPLLEADTLYFAPGMTMQKDFFIQNDSTADVYYKLYFSNVQGGLADVLEIKICNGETVLYQGSAVELTQKRVAAADDILRPGERRDLTVYISFPESATFNNPDLFLSFSLSADAVQCKNNPEKLFN